MSQDLIEELKFNDKWLSKEYKDSKEYRKYLSTVTKKLIRATWQTTEPNADE